MTDEDYSPSPGDVLADDRTQEKHKVDHVDGDTVVFEDWMDQPLEWVEKCVQDDRLLVIYRGNQDD